MLLVKAKHLGGLVLVVVVDRVVPATIAHHVSYPSLLPMPVYDHVCSDLQEGLATITPGEVLGADVLVGVLGTLLQRRHVGPVLPMLVPENPGVVAGKDKEGDSAAKFHEVSISVTGRNYPNTINPVSSNRQLKSYIATIRTLKDWPGRRRFGRADNRSGDMSRGSLLDGDFLPQLCDMLAKIFDCLRAHV